MRSRPTHPPATDSSRLFNLLIWMSPLAQILVHVKWGPDTIKLLLTLFVVTIKTCKPTLPNELYKAVQKAAIEVTVTQTL